MSSLEDLLARCIVANEQNLSQSVTISPEEIATSLGLSFPGDTTNSELNSLLPIYMQFLRDVQDNAEKSPFVDLLRLSSRKTPDAAIVLLYFIEFPVMVLKIRESCNNINGCSVNEKFNCRDLIDQMAKNSFIIKWCRCALSSSKKHNAVVLASCINILDSVNSLPKMKARKHLMKNVLCLTDKSSRDYIIEKFQLLRSDLADVVSRDDVTRDVS